jgi:hypothetical protein
MFRPMRLVLACCCLMVAVFSAPASGQPTPVARITADVGEWSVVPSVGVVRAGRVRITVRNVGAVTHQIVVVKTESFDAYLQLQEDRAVVRPLARPVLVRPGGASSFVVSLTRGSYLLLDNLPSRYQKGTSVAFSVR